VSEDHKEKQNTTESQSSPFMCVSSVLPHCKEHCSCHTAILQQWFTEFLLPRKQPSSTQGHRIPRRAGIALSRQGEWWHGPSLKILGCLNLGEKKKKAKKVEALFLRSWTNLFLMH